MNSHSHNKVWLLLILVPVVIALTWQKTAAQVGPDVTYPVAVADGLTQVEKGSGSNLWNHNCVMCHQSKKLNGMTQDATLVSLTVDQAVLDQSVHGSQGLTCTSCHTTFEFYPHQGKEQVTCVRCHEENNTIVADLPYKNLREMKTDLNQACRNCHASLFSANSMHTDVINQGEVKTPLCTDCHGGHDVQHPSDPPARVGNICGQCHTAVISAFEARQHNSANPDSMTCVTCHQAHDVKSSAAETPSVEPTQAAAESEASYLSRWNSTCTMCHAYGNLTATTRDSTTFSLTVTDQDVQDSVHGKAGLGCTACHQSITGYPHSSAEQIACSRCHGAADPNAEVNAHVPYDNRRALSIDLNQICQSCHEKQFTESENSIHTQYFKSGNALSPLCVDCHGSHNIQSPAEPRLKISQSCATCHASVYTSYQSSVHGVAVEKDGSPSAPTCVDCHGTHDASGPSESSFRKDSVLKCIECHQNTETMAQARISVEVFSPYIDSFHGTPASLFTQGDAELAKETVVCYDCHGVHNIRATDDPFSMVNPANLINTCQQCHPDASSRFTNAGLGHLKSRGETLPVLSWLNRFYQVLILVVVAFSLLYVTLDARKRQTQKRKLNQAMLGR